MSRASDSCLLEAHLNLELLLEMMYCRGMKTADLSAHKLSVLVKD